MRNFSHLLYIPKQITNTSSSFNPNKTNRDVKNIRRFAEVWRVDCKLDTFLFAREKLLNE